MVNKSLQLFYLGIISNHTISCIPSCGFNNVFQNAITRLGHVFPDILPLAQSGKVPTLISLDRFRNTFIPQYLGFWFKDSKIHGDSISYITYPTLNHF